MAQNPSTDGQAVQVALIDRPFAGLFIAAATGGDFSMTDGGMSPIDFFQSSASSSPCSSVKGRGIAFVIVNCLATPLTLVQISGLGAGQTSYMRQGSYPATANPNPTASNPSVWIRENQIPAMRRYPMKEKHGADDLLWGLGMYRMASVCDPQDPWTPWPAYMRPALAFSCQEDGKSGPFLGVGAVVGGRTSYSETVGVTTDVVGAYGDLDGFMTHVGRNSVSHSDGTPTGVNIFASLPSSQNVAPALEKDYKTVTVYVRDSLVL